MFGQNTGGGLFGNNSNQAGGGGLFGQPQQPQFGQPAANGGGGLFGGAPNSFGGGGGGGLFGGNTNTQNNPSTGGGLFGGAGTGLGGAPASNGGGLFGAPANNTQGNGGGIFGGAATTGGNMFGNTNNNLGGGGGGLFGGPSQPPQQPSAFSLNNPSTGGGGLFGAATTTNNMGGGGGLFGGGATTGFGANNGMLGNNNNNRTAGNGIFGGAPTTAPAQGAGMFGGMANNNTGGGLFGMNNATNNNTGAFGATNPTAGGGGIFGGAAGNTGGGLFGGNNAQGGSLLGTANSTAGGLLGGGFNMNNNTGGILGQNNNSFGLGSFGANNNPAAAPFQPKASANAALTKPNEKNLCYSISNGTDFCIFELALTQRKLVKAGQLKPGAQNAGMFGQTGTGLAPSGGGLFGGAANTNANPLGGGGNAPLFGGAANNNGGIFGGGASTTNTGGGLFGKSATTGAGGGLFGQPQQQTGGFLGQAPQTGGGGLFGAGSNTSAPAGGGLFGGNTTGAATGGGLFGGNPQTGAASGGLFGGQPSNNQGGLFLNTANTNPNTGGGLFGGATTAPATGGGGLFGGAATGQTGLNTGGGGLFGANPATSQPAASGGLFGATAPQQNGLFGGATTTQQTGGLFGGATGIPQQQGGGLFGQTSANPAQGGGLFGATNTGLGGAAPMGAQQPQAGLNGFQTLIQLLEQSQNQNNNKFSLDDDTEQTWVYGKLRDGYSSGSLGYFQGGDNLSQSSNKFIQLEQQSLYGYQKKKQAYDQFRNLALRDEKEKKDEMKKLLSSFSSSFAGIGSEQKKSLNFGSQSQTLPTRQGKLSGSSEVSQVSEKLKLIEKNDLCIDFIKSGTSNRIRIPVKPRYNFGDVKYKILNELINNDSDVNVRNFRLQARIKGTNKAPKPLRDNDSVFNNKNLSFETIDYIELVERSGNLSSLNATLNNNNNTSNVLNNIPNDETDDRSSLQNNSRDIDQRTSQKDKSQSISLPNGFSSMPSVEELDRFTQSQLAKVENFVLENDCARIVFQEPVNLNNLDLTQLIFEESRISLEQVAESDRLNKKCIIEFKKFGLKQLISGKSKDDVKTQVEKLVKKKNLQLVKPYDVENTKLVYIQDKFY